MSEPLLLRMRARADRLRSQWAETIKNPPSSEVKVSPLVREYLDEGSTGVLPGFVFSVPSFPGLPNARWDRTNATKALRDLFREAGFEWQTSHSSRRGLITELHRNGVALADIAGFVGHSTIGPTMGYVKVKSDPARAAAVAAALGGTSIPTLSEVKPLEAVDQEANRLVTRGDRHEARI